MQCCGMPNTGNYLGVCHQLNIEIADAAAAAIVTCSYACAAVCALANARRNPDYAAVAMALGGSCGYCCVVAAVW